MSIEKDGNIMMKELTATLSASIVLTSVAPSAAGDLPYRQAVAASSNAKALGGQRVNLLQRMAGPGCEPVFAEVLVRVVSLNRSIGTNEKYKSRVEPGVSWATGEGWGLVVRGEGEWIHYHNNAYVYGPKNPRLPVEARPPASALEGPARAFIQSDLASAVNLEPGDELRGWSVSYTSQVGTNGVTQTQAVVSSRIVFTRVIGGVPVLGAGSKVAVTVANDGTLVGFDVDWPRLKATGRETETVGLAAVRERLSQVSTALSGPNPPTEGWFGCGYYDPGSVSKPRSSLVQPGCTSTLIPADPGAFGITITVPAGVTVAEDRAWPETSIFKTG